MSGHISFTDLISSLLDRWFWINFDPYWWIAYNPYRSAIFSCEVLHCL